MASESLPRLRTPGSRPAPGTDPAPGRPPEPASGSLGSLPNSPPAPGYRGAAPSTQLPQTCFPHRVCRGPGGLEGMWLGPREDQAGARGLPVHRPCDRAADRIACSSGSAPPCPKGSSKPVYQQPRKEMTARHSPADCLSFQGFRNNKGGRSSRRKKIQPAGASSFGPQPRAPRRPGVGRTDAIQRRPQAAARGTALDTCVGPGRGETAPRRRGQFRPTPDARGPSGLRVCGVSRRPQPRRVSSAHRGAQDKTCACTAAPIQLPQHGPRWAASGTGQLESQPRTLSGFCLLEAGLHPPLPSETEPGGHREANPWDR